MRLEGWNESVPGSILRGGRARARPPQDEVLWVSSANLRPDPFFALEFPENRENNREFAIFLTGLTIFDVKSCINFNILHTNSLQIKTGNVFRPNRELIPGTANNRDFSSSYKTNRPKRRAASQLKCKIKV